MLTAIRNTFANFVGGLAVIGALLTFNALYFRMASEEVYGIMSLFLIAVMMAPALDLGTGRTAGRFLAKDLATKHGPGDLRDAVATLQVTNLFIGLALGAALALAAPAVTTGWLAPQQLSTDDVVVAVSLLAATIPLLVQRAYFSACLNGMKRQVLANMLMFVFTVLRGVAGLIALLSEGDALQAFFLSQLAVQAVDTFVSGVVVWRLVPKAERRTRLEPDVLRSSWRFAAGDGATALIGACLVQGDKILLSALLPLSSYGAYVLISTVASGIGRFTSPFSAAFLPHFVELMALGRKDELRNYYAVSTQLLSCVILPVAAVLFAFAPEIVDAVLGTNERPKTLPLAFALLVVGTIFNNLLHLPHGIQLAAGNSTTALRYSAFNAVLYVALIVILVPKLGVLAPALSLIAIYTMTGVLFTRVTNKMLSLSGLDWVGHSILFPGIAAAAIATVARLVTPAGLGPAVGVLWLAVVTLVAIGAALVASPRARRSLVELDVWFGGRKD